MASNEIDLSMEDWQQQAVQKELKAYFQQVVVEVCYFNSTTYYVADTEAHRHKQRDDNFQLVEDATMVVLAEMESRYRPGLDCNQASKRRSTSGYYPSPVGVTCTFPCD